MSGSLRPSPHHQTTTAPASILDEHRSRPGLLLALLGQEAMRRLRGAHTAPNLKPRQFQILGLLHDHNGLAQRELMQQMKVDPSILVTLLNPLEADGLVSRERDRADRRRHLVTPGRPADRAARRARGRHRRRLQRSRRARARGGGMRLTVFAATGGVGDEVVARASAS